MTSETETRPRAVISKVLTVDLDDNERVGKLKLIAELLDDLDDHDADAGETKRKLAETRRQITDKLTAARHAQATGREEREVQVVAVPNPNRWEIEYHDAESGKVYPSLTREMTGEERAKHAQVDLEDVPGVKKGRKAKAKE